MNTQLLLPGLETVTSEGNPLQQESRPAQRKRAAKRTTGASEGRLLKQFQPVIAMTLVEIFCPAWQEEECDPDDAPLSIEEEEAEEELPIPDSIRLAFPETVRWYEAGGSGTGIIFGCELSRAIKLEEAQALAQAKQEGSIWHYQLMTK